MCERGCSPLQGVYLAVSVHVCIFIAWCLVCEAVSAYVAARGDAYVGVHLSLCICAPLLLGFQCEQNTTNRPSPTWAAFSSVLYYVSSMAGCSEFAICLNLFEHRHNPRT